jgi:NADP-dependent 3-hydroxy acid dehydrogenase YdfG
MNKLENKVGLITGGTKGIGLGVAHAMLQVGMDVAITGRSLASTQEVAATLSKQYNKEVLGLEADVRDYEAMEKANHAIVDKWGKIDAVIANAGVGHFAPIDELSLDQWKDTIDINLTGVFNTVKSTLGAIQKSEGYIISIASLAGTNFFAGGAAYNASKFGLVGFTQAIMLDLRKQGIKVSTVMPGSVATYFNNRIPTEADAWKIQPEDIGEIVVDLLKMPARTLPSKVEVRPSFPKSK